MSDDPRTQQLYEWNRLARENTENAMVSSMYDAGLKSSAPIETFSTWLLVGAGAIASFLIAHSDKVIPLISPRGFVVCGAFLIASCAFGLLAKIYALLCRIGIETSQAVRKTFREHLSKYAEEEEKIKQSAQSSGITLETGIRMERVLTQFYRLLPRWICWLASRQLKKHEGNPQAAYSITIQRLNRQGLCVLLQSLLFLGFLVAGFAWAA